MKEQIQKILAMAKAGTITDEQAAELIEALSAKDEPAPEPPRTWARPSHFGDRFGLLERVVDAWSGGRTSTVNGVLPSQVNGNDFSMSQVDVIEGADFVFRDNHVRMSVLKDITLTRSEMTGNDIGSSKVHDITCSDGALSGCIIHASSVEDVNLSEAQMTKVHMRATKFADTRLTKSRFDDVTITASAVKNLSVVDGSIWERSRIEATQLKNVDTTATTVSNVGFDMSRLTNVDVKRSVLRISMVRGYKWSDVKVLDCVFDDVMFGAGDASRKCLVKDSTFDNCKFEKAIFADTSIVDTTIRNVTLSGVRVVGVHLRDQVIDGNEQFIAAIGGERALAKHAADR